MNEVKKNHAPKALEGRYTLEVKGKNVVLGDSEGNTYVAKCHPDDVFNLAKGADTAINVMLDQKNIISVGDTVEVISNSHSYTTYAEWVNNNILPTLPFEAVCYAHSSIPKNGTKATVLFIGKHGHSNADIAYIQAHGFFNSRPCYLVGLEGLKRVGG